MKIKMIERETGHCLQSLNCRQRMIIEHDGTYLNIKVYKLKGSFKTIQKCILKDCDMKRITIEIGGDYE